MRTLHRGHYGRAKLAGVMGWPVAHSRSPRLHGFWLAQHDIDGAYLPLPVRPENLAAALKALPALGFAGVNLTVPHKEAALGLVDRSSDEARRHRRGEYRGGRRRRAARRQQYRRLRLSGASESMPRRDGARSTAPPWCWALAAPRARLRRRCWMRACRSFAWSIAPLARGRGTGGSLRQRRARCLARCAPRRSRMPGCWSTARRWAWWPAGAGDRRSTTCRARPRLRHRLCAAGDAASGRGAAARQTMRRRARHAAAPGPAGLCRLVRRRARGDAGTARIRPGIPMKILCLTGSVGMGKTTAARMLRSMGIPVHDADAEVHRLLGRGGAAVKAVEAAFPGVKSGRVIDRAALGRIVFANPAALQAPGGHPPPAGARGGAKIPGPGPPRASQARGPRYPAAL